MFALIETTDALYDRAEVRSTTENHINISYRTGDGNERHEAIAKKTVRFFRPYKD